MSGAESIDPGTFQAESSAFDQKGERLIAAVGELQMTLGQLGACWGDDHPGETFGSHYQPSASDVITGVQHLGTGLITIGTQLNNVAATVTQLGTASHAPAGTGVPDGGRVTWNVEAMQQGLDGTRGVRDQLHGYQVLISAQVKPLASSWVGAATAAMPSWPGGTTAWVSCSSRWTRSSVR
jgi:uncharacterized protein YukE